VQVVLTAITGKPEVTEVVFGPGEYLIGRSQECDVRIGVDNRQAVSRRHCTVTVTEQGTFVHDLGSRYGTWVNSRRVAQKQALWNGDRLGIGTIVFLVRTDGKCFPEKASTVPCDTADILCRAVRPFPDETVDAPIDRTLG
jgi:pSer/pThr/pTyr-binding forkhead associated (FHA) protein